MITGMATAARAKRKPGKRKCIKFKNKIYHQYRSVNLLKRFYLARLYSSEVKIQPDVLKKIQLNKVA
jgi:hypothetical protein